MSRTRTFATVFALATALSARAAQAEDVGSILEVLEQNVVTGASRSAERATDAPAMSSTVTADELRRYGIHRLDQALNFLSLGMFSHGRMGAAEVGARGVALARDANSHVLVVLDGMIVNEQAGGTAFLHDIPMELVDHIEVILGPGSVLYGSQAMLGVINVVTKSVKDYQGIHASASAGLSPPIGADGEVKAPTRFSSLGHDNDYSLGIGRSFLLLGRPASLVASLDYADFKGPRMEFNRQALPNVDLGPRAQPGFWGGPVDKQWYRRTAGAYTRLEVGDLSWMTRASVARLAMPQMDLFESRAPAAYDDPHNANDSTLILSNLRYQHRFSEHLLGIGRAYFGFSRRENSRFVIGHESLIPGVPLGVVDPEQCPIGPTGPCRKDALFFSRWLGLELQSIYDWKGDGAYTTLVGVDGRSRTSAYEFVTFDVETGQSYGSNPALTRWHAGGYDKADEYALGAYLQQTVRPWKFLALNAGIRTDLDSRIATAGDAISPRAAVIATPNDNLSFKLIYSKAFRAPSFLELNIVNGRLLPSPGGLAPETVSSFEGAATLKVMAYTLTLGGFYADWHNLIELQILNAQAPAVSRHANVARIKNYGASLSFEGAMLDGSLRFGLNSMLTAADRMRNPDEIARNGDGDSVPLTVAPRVYGNARASYQFGEDTTVALAAGYFGRRIADQAYYGGDPSNLAPRPEAPPELELRCALTGEVPRFHGVGYSVGADYAFASRQPFVVGPNQGLPRYLSPAPVDAELALVNRLTVFAGLELQFDASMMPTPGQTASGGSSSND
jgi:outer membrane receptor protein involved in Fe transport